MSNEDRKRGGQPNNVNALKHGFYSKRFKGEEIADLSALVDQGLENEVVMLRVMTRRLFELADSCGEASDLAGILATLGATSVRLASLMKTQKLLTGGSSDVETALKQALAEIKREWNLR